jgi:putative membrane protein
MCRLSLLALAVLPAVAKAHGLGGNEPGVEPWIAMSLALSAIAYVMGLSRIWSRAGIGRGIARGQAASFASGWLSLVVAASATFERLSAHSFSLHMIEHEMLMLIAAPLLVAGRPLAVFAWAFPRGIRADLRLPPTGRVRAAWALLTAPALATFVQLGALWAWHAPGWFEAALGSRGLHALQHTTFLVTALCFWWAVREGLAARAGVSCASLFVTMIGSGALGALLTFSSALWYPAYAGVSSPLGWTPLEEQQVGGLLMWIPGGMLYMAVALWRVHRGLAAMPRSIREPEYA